MKTPGNCVIGYAATFLLLPSLLAISHDSPPTTPSNHTFYTTLLLLDTYIIANSTIHGLECTNNVCFALSKTKQACPAPCLTE